MIVAVQFLLLGVLGFFLAYLAWLSLLALLGRKRRQPEASRLRRFAVVVPAHNEAPVIEKTLASLLSIAYPSDRFDVVVVADNCDDQTAEIARSLGVRVYERTDTANRGKGYALRWIFDQLLIDPVGYDACCVVDADSVVSENFLSVLNGYLEQGMQAAQCSDMVDAQPDAWNVEVTRIGFMLHNYVRPLGRRQMGCPAPLFGNGMCFTVETLRRVPWQAYSITEDLEYGLLLLLHDIPVVFAPEAGVLATMPHQASNAVSQHTRWAVGRFPLIRKYTGRLFSAALRRASFKAFDAWLQLVTPAFVDMMAVVMVMLGLGLGQWAFGVEHAEVLVGVGAFVLGLGVFHVVIGLYAAGADRLMYKAFIYFPRYAFWKGLVAMKIIRHRRMNKWVRTTREHVVEQAVDDCPKL